jgi:two-component system, response regulator RegA
MGLEGASLLLVDDDDVLRERLARALERRGYQVRTAASAEQALALARVQPSRYAIIDLRMPGRSGLDLLRELRLLDASCQALILTGYGSIPTAVEATRLGAIGYLQKPVDANDVVAALERLDGTSGVDAALIETPSLARAEWEHIQRVLADCGGNVSEAARRLGIHRRSLQRKLQKYPPAR